MTPSHRNCDSGFSDSNREGMLRQVAQDAPGKVALFERVYRGKTSPKQAIKAKCLECTWMDQSAISECTATDCPLWAFRPYQRKAGTGGRHE
jgi:hypothetical protein